MKKLLICFLILLSTFSLYAKEGNILLTGGPSFNTAYSVKNRSSVESVGVDLGLEFQLGKDSHLMIISELGLSYPIMHNFTIHNYQPSPSLVLGSDLFIGLGFNTGFDRDMSFTFGAGPYLSSMNVSDGASPFSSLSLGAEIFGAAKLFITDHWYVGTAVRAGMTIFDWIGISFFDWTGNINASSSNTFTLTCRLGCGYLF